MYEKLTYAMAISKVSGLGIKKLNKYKSEIFELDNEHAAYDLLKNIQKAYPGRIKIIPKQDDFYNWIETARICLRLQEQYGIHSITCKDIDYPSGFNELDSPPLYFFYKGNKAALQKKGIAVIGTRQTTDFSYTVGTHVGRFIAENGWAVISGLAIGCDTAGHEGCLAACNEYSLESAPVAIVGTGLNTVYPKKNAGLQERILQTNGCIISEYPIGIPFYAQHLIERDRLQSGLACGVFVIATGENGGTWHAINTAIDLKKPVAYFDYTAYPNHENPYIDGIKKLREIGAKPIRDKETFLAFLEECKNSSGKENLPVMNSLF